MNFPLDIPIKVKEDDLERDNNANISKVMFDVEVKVEKEIVTDDETDWCVTALTFDSPGDLLEPLFFKPVTEQLLWKCDFCHIYCTDELSTAQHNLVHLSVVIRNPKLYQCDRCSSYFTDKHVVKCHIYEFKCNTTYIPKQHYNMYENPSKTLNLKYKPKAYMSVTDSTADSKYHTQGNNKKLKDGMTNLLQYKPKACKQKFKTKQLYECNICGNDKTYTYKQWHGHMSEVHGDGGYICGICKIEFKCERYFMRHMTKRHNERFSPQKKMPERKPSTKGSDTVFINCDECDAVLQCKNALKTHKRNVHSKEKHVCSICDSTLKCKSYLLAHMRRVHYDDGKMHFCECGKKFRSPRYLAVHKKNAHFKKKNSVM